MMRRKNALEYIVLALFIMCIAFALSASLEYSSVGTQRPYLLQGTWLLSLVVLGLAAFVGIRVVNKAAPNMSEKLKTWLTVGVCAVLFLVGLGLRIYVIERMPLEPESDYETYYRIARELVDDTLLTPEGDLDRRYVAMYPHTIGFPMLILQPAFLMFGQSVKVALYANLLCSMISVILCTHIGKRLAGRLGAVLAMLLMSLWPSHVLYANMVATEQSFTMFILMAADMMIGVLPRGKGSLYDHSPNRVMALLILIGIVLAVAGAVRPMALLLLAAFSVVLLMQGHDPAGEVPLEGGRYALSKGWFCVVLVAVPYLLAGQVISRAISDAILEEPASGITASGYNLMVGVNVKAEGRWNEEDSNFFGDKYDTLGNANEAHSACMQVAIQRITGEPENVLNLLIFKFRDLWQTDDFGIDWNLQWADHQGTLTPELKASLEALRPVGRLLYMAVLVCTLLCALNAWRDERAPQPMLTVFVLFYLGTALSHMLLETQVRYHYNMLPFLMLTAVMGLISWRERLLALPPVKVVYREESASDSMKEHEDNTHFDMNTALREGNIIMTVTAAYQRDAEAAAPASAETQEQQDLRPEETAASQEVVPAAPETDVQKKEQ